MMSSSRSSWSHAPAYPLRPARPVPVGGPAADQLDQPGLFGVAGGHGEVGEAGGHQPEVEGAGGGQFGGLVDHPGPPGEPAELLGLPAEAGSGGWREPPLEVGKGPPRPDGGQGGGQREPGRRGVVHVVGGHRGDAPLDGQHRQGVVTGGVDGIAVVPELDSHLLTAEPVDQVVERPPGGGGPTGGEAGGEGALAASGEDVPVAAMALGQRVEGDDRLPLLSSRQVGLGDDPAEAGIALGVPGQHDQVGAVGVGHADPDMRATRPGDGELGPEHGGQAEGPGGLGEADHAVETVVIGQGEAGQTQPGRLGDQLVGMAGTVEEREVGVGVQLGVGHVVGTVMRRWLRPTNGPLRRPAGGPRAP